MAQDDFRLKTKFLLTFTMIVCCLLSCAPAYVPSITTSLPAPEKNMITDIGKETGKEKTTLIIYSAQMANYTSFAQPDPPAVILDIPDVYLHHNLMPITFAEGPIKKVIPEQISSDEKGVQTRITLKLNQAFPYEIIRDDNQLKIAIKHQMPVLKPAVEALLVDAYKGKKVTEKTPSPEISEARVRERPLEAGPPSVVSEVEATEVSKFVMPEREILRSVPIVEKEEKKAEAPKEKKVTAKAIPEEAPVKSVPETAVEEDQKTVKISEEIDLLFGRKTYTGKPISLDFQNADIRSVLRIIANVSGYNLVIDPEVKGKVDITLVKPVPWDQALEVILKTNKLDMKMEGNIIRVGLPETFAAEKDAELKAIQAVRQAKQEKTKTIPLTTRLIPINYAKADVLMGKIQPMLSKSEGLAEPASIMVDERTNTLIIKDIPEVIDDIMEVIYTLDRPTPQVMIEARIVETNKNFAKDMGIQWGGAYARTTNYRFPNTVDVSGQTGTDSYAVNLPIASSAFGAIGINLGHVNGETALDIQLKAMEQSGQGKVISNPRIATLDNEEATIKSGYSIPYQTTDAEGNPSTNFVDAAINLTVTPQITPDKNITMKIQADKSEPDWSNTVAGAPSIITRNATTSLIVANGDTAVIGGLAQKNEGSNFRKIPIFGDIPVLGLLFKARDSTDKFDELLIFITPRIIETN